MTTKFVMALSPAVTAATPAAAYPDHPIMVIVPYTEVVCASDAKVQ